MPNTNKMIWRPKFYVTEVPLFHRYVSIYRDYWWAIDADGNVAFYGERDRSPQCNLSEDLMKRHVKRGIVPGAVAVEQIPVAFVRINISDYCD